MLRLIVNFKAGIHLLLTLDMILNGIKRVEGVQSVQLCNFSGTQNRAEASDGYHLATCTLANLIDFINNPCSIYKKVPWFWMS